MNPIFPSRHLSILAYTAMMVFCCLQQKGWSESPRPTEPHQMEQMPTAPSEPRSLSRPASAHAPSLPAPSQSSPPSAHGSQAHGNSPNSPVPEPYPVQRYRPIWERSPFTLSSVSTEPTAGFASNLILVAVGQIDDSRYARVLDKVSKQRMTVTPDPNASGITLVSLDTNDDPLKASARVKKGNEEAVIRYDATLLKSSPTIPPPVSKAASGQPPQAQNNNNKKATRRSKRAIKRRRRIIVPNRPPANR